MRNLPCTYFLLRSIFASSRLLHLPHSMDLQGDELDRLEKLDVDGNLNEVGMAGFCDSVFEVVNLCSLVNWPASRPPSPVRARP